MPAMQGSQRPHRGPTERPGATESELLAATTERSPESEFWIEFDIDCSFWLSCELTCWPLDRFG